MSNTRTTRSSLPAPLASNSQKSQYDFSIIQHNCAGSNSILLSLFSLFQSFSLPSIVAIQEKFLFHGRPLVVPCYPLISPVVDESSKVILCFYFLNSFIAVTSFIPLFFNTGDFCGIFLSFKSSG